jgi:hypothetical protein
MNQVEVIEDVHSDSSVWKYVSMIGHASNHGVYLPIVRKAIKCSRIVSCCEAPRELGLLAIPRIIQAPVSLVMILSIIDQADLLACTIRQGCAGTANG